MRPFRKMNHSQTVRAALKNEPTDGDTKSHVQTEGKCMFDVTSTDISYRFLESVLLQHVSDAADLFLIVTESSALPIDFESFDRVCRRCEANIDALRLAGQRGV